MSDQKVSAGFVEVYKQTADLKLGLTTIILSAEDEYRLKHIMENLHKIHKDFNCEIILVTNVAPNSEEHFQTLHKINGTYLYLPQIAITKAGLQNIGRQLASKDSKYLLFLDDFNAVSKEWLEDRVKGFEFNPIIGIIGRGMPKVTDEIKQKLFDDLQGLIRLSDEDFKERCCDKDGGFRNVSEQTLATPTAVFDRIGGFDILNEYPNLVYQARVQALGFGVVPHNI